MLQMHTVLFSPKVHTTSSAAHRPLFSQTWKANSQEKQLVTTTLFQGSRLFGELLNKAVTENLAKEDKSLPSSLPQPVWARQQMLTLVEHFFPLTSPAAGNPLPFLPFSENWSGHELSPCGVSHRVMALRDTSRVPTIRITVVRAAPTDAHAPSSPMEPSSLQTQMCGCAAHVLLAFNLITRSTVWRGLCGLLFSSFPRWEKRLQSLPLNWCSQVP